MPKVRGRSVQQESRDAWRDQDQHALFTGSKIRVGAIFCAFGGSRSGLVGVKSAYASFTPEYSWRWEYFSRVTPAWPRGR